MKKLLNTLIAKATIAKTNLTQTVKDNSGMEVVQVLIVVIISITLGAILLVALKAEFATLLTTVGDKIEALFITA